MLMPKKTKYRKVQKGRNRGFSNSTQICFGTYGLKAITRGRLSSKQIEAARRVIAHSVKRQVIIWIRIFPDKPITKKPLEVRMGKGKGDVDHWVAVIKPGAILYEIADINENVAKHALLLASAKLSIKTVFVKKMYGYEHIT